MISEVHHYLRTEVAPRICDILGGAEFWLAAAASLGLVCQPDLLCNARVTELSSGLISYAAIAAGFTLAGMTMSLTLSDSGFVREIARDTRKDGNAYGQLVFVFSWTALAHWALLVLSLYALLRAHGQAVLPPDPSLPRRMYVAAVAFFAMYGAAQFLIVVITLSQVARRYRIFLASSVKEDGASGSRPLRKPRPALCYHPVAGGPFRHRNSYAGRPPRSA